MASATIRGAQIRYEVLGEGGPWFVLTPGGRWALDALTHLGEKIAAAGYRVLLHDRLNCGASDVVISDAEWEEETTADYLYELMQQLDATPAIVAAQGGGNRTSFFMALRHPEALQGAAFCYPSGGRQAAEILAHDYYGQFAEAAREGGMAAVCETEYYRERIEQNPRNRDILLSLPATEFAAAMERWRDGFLASADWPTIAVTEERLRSIDLPVCVIAGLTDDHIHGLATSEAVARAIPGADIRYLPDERRPADAERSWLADALGRRGRSAELLDELLGFAGRVTGAEAQHAPSR